MRFSIQQARNSLLSIQRLNTFISDEELAVVENKIPTAVSQLLNDSNFVDNTYIPSQILNSNQNGQISIWTGTKSEYNLIEEKNQNCLYIITDEKGDFPMTDVVNAVLAELPTWEGGNY